MSQTEHCINRHVLFGLPGPCGVLAQQPAVLVCAGDLVCALMRSEAITNVKVLAQPPFHATYRYVLKVSNNIPVAI